VRLALSYCVSCANAPPFAYRAPERLFCVVCSHHTIDSPLHRPLVCTFFAPPDPIMQLFKATVVAVLFVGTVLAQTDDDDEPVGK
jgi:hypothetical protein